MKPGSLSKWLIVLVIVAIPYLSSFSSTELLQKVELQFSFLNENRNPLEWKDSIVVTKADECAYKLIFNVNEISGFKSLTLNIPPNLGEITLNGEPVPLPFENMRFESIPGIPVEMLNSGHNILIAKKVLTKLKKRKYAQKPGKPTTLSSEKVDFSLLGMLAEDVKMVSGPVLGYASESIITMSARLNMPAELKLELGNKSEISNSGLLHQFKIEGLTPDTEYTYLLKARVNSDLEWMDISDTYSVKTYPENEKFSFIAMGDGRGNPEVWGEIAERVAGHNPLFCVNSGDMVGSGRNDVHWNYQLFDPAKEFFATIPFYPSIGNHEGSSSLFNKFFYTPSGTTNWKQDIGQITIIGIDGSQDWSENSGNIHWLDAILSGSNAKFIFLFTHYPAWSSGKHGLMKDGIPIEKSMQESQQVILPLLAKYKTTAMIAGHDHHYERSETPGGTTVIVSGGAGADLRSVEPNDDNQNPYSKIISVEYHYCLISVDKDVCTMTVYNLKGEALDTRTWNSRSFNYKN